MAIFFTRGLLLLAVLYYSAAQDQANLVAEDVVVIPGANPRVAVIYWKPVSDDRVSLYRVYYSSNTTSSSNEYITEVIYLANSAMVDDLAVGHHYTFTVSVGYILNGVLSTGPRSSNSSITTGLTVNVDSSDDGNQGTAAIVFYGCLLVLSMAVNVVLLGLSYILLKQLRSKYSGSNTTSINTGDSPIIELKTVRHSCHDNDIPRKPAREHLPKEAILDLNNGRCTPAKQAEVEVV